MQHPEAVMNFPTSSEMELYRYLAAAASAGGGGGEIGGQDDVVVGMNHHHGGFGGSCSNNYNHNNKSVSNNNNNYSSCCSSFYPGMMNETTESKAIVASRLLHKEAEKRRRERINSHLDRLRSLLPCTSKTDKATLLSKVVQRVLELKRQTSELLDINNLMIPSENDEFGVYIHEAHNNNNNTNTNTNTNPQCHSYDEDDIIDEVDDNNKLILRASLCCEDRPDLFTDLNQVLTSLNLKTLRAEISTLGGRIQSVLLVSGDKNSESDEDCLVFLRDALKGIVQKSGSDDRLKRRRRAFDPNCS